MNLQEYNDRILRPMADKFQREHPEEAARIDRDFEELERCGVCDMPLRCDVCGYGVRRWDTVRFTLFIWALSCAATAVVTFLGTWLFFSTAGALRWP